MQVARSHTQGRREAVDDDRVAGPNQLYQHQARHHLSHPDHQRPRQRGRMSGTHGTAGPRLDREASLSAGNGTISGILVPGQGRWCFQRPIDVHAQCLRHLDLPDVAAHSGTDARDFGEVLQPTPRAYGEKHGWWLAGELAIGRVGSRSVHVLQTIYHLVGIVILLDGGCARFPCFQVYSPQPGKQRRIDDIATKDKVVLGVQGFHMEAGRALADAVHHQTWRKPDPMILVVNDATTLFVDLQRIFALNLDPCHLKDVQSTAVDFFYLLFG